MSDDTKVLDAAQEALALGDAKEALRLAEESIELQPESAKSWFMKGKSLFQLTEYVGAISAFQSAIDHGIAGDDFTDAKSLSEEAKLKQVVKAVKRDWYQTDSHVIINVLIKKVKADNVNVNYGKDSLEFSVAIPDTGATYELNLKLAKNIDPQSSAFKVTPSKIEIRLKKSDSSRWADLELANVDPNVKTIEEATPTETTASYPTSSKKVKDWNRLEKEVVQEEKDEKLEGDAALNKLFQQIYGDASEETKRAMNKSFQESNGTVLSTNWGDIGGKKTEMQCPDGMEFKKY